MRPGTCKWIVPEVVQTSVMDCGPAALIGLLDGFGVSASYARLREACHTDLDGTSMDALEHVARELGLDAEVVLKPVDHVLLRERVTSIAVVRMAGGYTHFVVVWRRHGRWVQVMDPGVGRRWPTCEAFSRSISVHGMAASTDAWREYAQADAFTAGLRTRLERLGHARADAARLVDRALADGGWRPIGALDATARMIESVASGRGVRRGRDTVRLVDHVYGRTIASADGPDMPVPPIYWSVQPLPPGAGGELLVRGAAVLEARGLRARAPAPARPAPAASAAPPPPPNEGLAAAVQERRPEPWRDLARVVRVDGTAAPALLAVGVVLAAAATVLEALILRAILYVARYLELVEQRLVTMATIVTIIAVLLLFDGKIAASALGMGRRLETRLRAALFEKLTRLPDRYFQSRLASDMAERSHAAAALRSAPPTVVRLLRLGAQILFTVVAMAWLDPGSLAATIAIAVASLALPLAMNRVIGERDLRVQTHAGALSRFYLDALIGQVAIRAHSAERAIRRVHEELLTEWARAGNAMQRAAVVIEGLTSFTGLGLAAWLIIDHLHRVGAGGDVLLLAYWALSLPTIGNEFAVLARQLPFLRNLALRSLEPLNAPGRELPGEARARSAVTGGVDLRVERVTVLAGGHPILQELDVAIAPGTHVAVVGASGAGKSSLVGLFLGWHKPSDGRVRVDGEPLDADALDRLREQTAWVDPATMLWNEPLLDNVCYAVARPQASEIARVVEQAQLHDVVETLPDGLQTPLGEGGGLVSGGEGQRVRLARALLRADARLVLLDEPFRGLDRQRRSDLLRAARAQWKAATLVCVTHDVAETLAFDRVIVMHRGRIVEDGTPAELRARASRYRKMLETDASLHDRLSRAEAWRSVTLADGQLLSSAPEGTP